MPINPHNENNFGQNSLLFENMWLRINYLEEIKFFSDSQHGFLKGKNTTTAVQSESWLNG